MFLDSFGLIFFIGEIVGVVLIYLIITIMLKRGRKTYTKIYLQEFFTKKYIVESLIDILIFNTIKDELNKYDLCNIFNIIPNVNFKLKNENIYSFAIVNNKSIVQLFIFNAKKVNSDITDNVKNYILFKTKKQFSHDFKKWLISSQLIEK